MLETEESLLEQSSPNIHGLLSTTVASGIDSSLIFVGLSRKITTKLASSGPSRPR